MAEAENVSRAALQRAAEAVTAARSRANRSGGEFQVGYAPPPTARLLSATLRAFQVKPSGTPASLLCVGGSVQMRPRRSDR